MKEREERILRSMLRGLKWVLALCICLLLGWPGSAGVRAAEKVGELSGREAFRQVEGECLRPQVVFEGAERVSEAEMSTLELKAAARTKKMTDFYKKVIQQLLKRKTSFTIIYNGSYKDIYSKGPAYHLEQMSLMDDKSTSDDADFMQIDIYQIGYQMRFTSKKTSVTFHMVYWDDLKQVKAVNKKSAAVLKKLKISQYSTVGKIKAIHDYVVDLVQYDQTLADHSAYGGLVHSKHTTVCQGYALIMYKLLTDAGIPTRIVTGYAGGGSHAWNAVKIGKKWYHLDATFDDPVSWEPIRTYNYFLLGSVNCGMDHLADDFYASIKFNTKDYNWQKALKKSDNEADQKLLEDIPEW